MLQPEEAQNLVSSALLEEWIRDSKLTRRENLLEDCSNLE